MVLFFIMVALLGLGLLRNIPLRLNREMKLASVLEQSSLAIQKTNSKGFRSELP